jgi:hypothetical protein
MDAALQDLLPIAKIERFGHHRHHVRGRYGLSVAYGEGRIAIGVRAGILRKKKLAGDLEQRLFDPFGEHQTATAQSGHHMLTLVHAHHE